MAHVADVFKAIADPTRRALLDRLFRTNGLTLRDLCDGVDMTRFGVMQHLRVLQTAGLITTRRVGREKRHYLNPVPIRLIHDRWVSKYTGPFAAALVELKQHLERGRDGEMAENVIQVYQIVIRTTPERLWQTLTDAELTRRFPFYLAIESRFGIGDPIRWVDDAGRPQVEGTVLESERPHRLAHTWIVRYDPSLSHETSRITWVIEPISDSLCRLTVTHDLTTAPLTAAHITGGWMLILSGIKTLLETGEPMLLPAEN